MSDSLISLTEQVLAEGRARHGLPHSAPKRPELPVDPVRVSLRYVANQPAGAPCWRAIIEPPGALPENGLVVHRVTFAAPSWTEQGARGHVVGIGRVEWEPGDGLQLRVR